jgi:alanyl-tRNA synthetase
MPEDGVELFREQGFVRRRCAKCNRFFWTLSDRETCGEPPCEEYSFIGNSPTKKKLNLNEMREFYLSFFEKNDHERISRYPIVARWRDDLFFTIASISCFQPWVLNQTIDPPANPLVMSQTCLRFNDIDNVGKTGRHLTEFEMMAHHAFNTRDGFVYFEDRTVELCHELLLGLGIKPEGITYLEAEWSGGGNSGPCFEVIVGGVELATLVFMMYEDTPSGRKEMDMQVVDTGYGLERFVWLSQGTPNAYEAIFDYLLSKLKKELSIEPDREILGEYSKIAGMMNVESKADLNELRGRVADRIGIPVKELIEQTSPFEHLYAICDHTRALMFMLNDGGIVPSNVKAGYFARLLVRRTLRSLNSLNLKIPLREILSMQMDYSQESFQELMETRDDILGLIDVEDEKYRKTITRGGNIVGKLDEELRKKGTDTISTENLIHLYDSHGIVPEIVKEFSKLNVNIPDDFYIRVAGRHHKPKEAGTVKEMKIPKVEKTEMKFYEDAYVRKFGARIVKRFDDYVILDGTYFYPEGGGQETDLGSIGPLRVVDVQKVGNVVVHRVKGDLGKIKENSPVECEIDWDRRQQLMWHHTATHILNGAARRVLGNHAWQTGAHKSEELGRLDLTHHSGITQEERDEIEKLANKIVSEKRKINICFMERSDAEKKYGFRIYQGGAVPGKFIRVVDIEDWDVEACGGMHFENTSEVGSIRIINTRRVQDGVVRLEFKAGKALEKHAEKHIELTRGMEIEISEKDLQKISSIFSVHVEQLPKTIERFRVEWERQVEDLKVLEGRLFELTGIRYDTSKKYAEIPSGEPVESHRKLFGEWKSQRKEIEKLRKKIQETLLDGLERKLQSDFTERKGIRIVKEIFSGLDVKNLMEMAKSAVREKSLLILANKIDKKSNILVCSKSRFNAEEIAKKLSEKLGGGAHGNRELAIGGGSSEKLEEILDEFEP